MGDLNQRLDQIEKDLKEEIPTPDLDKPVATSKEIKVSKSKAKKKVKKSSVAKVAKTNGSENLVKLSELAIEAKLTTQGARKKLRETGLERSGRWSWEEGSKALKDARKALGLS